MGNKLTRQTFVEEWHSQVESGVFYACVMAAGLYGVGLYDRSGPLVGAALLGMFVMHVVGGFTIVRAARQAPGGDPAVIGASLVWGALPSALVLAVWWVAFDWPRAAWVAPLPYLCSVTVLIATALGYPKIATQARRRGYITAASMASALISLIGFGWAILFVVMSVDLGIGPALMIPAPLLLGAAFAYAGAKLDAARKSPPREATPVEDQGAAPG